MPAAGARHQGGSCHVQSLPDTISFHIQVLFKLGQCWQLGNRALKVSEGTFLEDE